MIRHIAIFQFEESKISDTLLASMKYELEALAQKIPQLLKMEVGINANEKEKQHLVLTADVNTLEDLESYTTHPAHIEVVKIIKPVAKIRTCVDYEL